MPTQSRFLFYTIVTDKREKQLYRQIGGLMIESLLASGASDVMLFKNWSGRISTALTVEEHFVPDRFDNVQEICRLKYMAGEYIDGAKYHTVCYLDADTLVLRSLASWLNGSWDVLYASEAHMRMHSKYHSGYLSDDQMKSAKLRLGVNAGFFAVKGHCYNTLMTRWRKIDESQPFRLKLTAAGDQPAWNRLVCDLGEGAAPLPHGAVAYPTMGQPYPWTADWDTRLVHFAGSPAAKKLASMRDLWTEITKTGVM